MLIHTGKDIVKHVIFIVPRNRLIALRVITVLKALISNLFIN